MNRKQRRRNQKIGSPSSAERTPLSASDQDKINHDLDRVRRAITGGNSPQASALLSDILVIAPDHPDALNLEATLLMNSGEISRAVKKFTKVAALAPDFAQAHFNLATALSAQGKFKSAIKSYQRALRLDCFYTDAHYNLANAYRQVGKILEAVNQYQETLKIAPTHSAAATNLASAHLQLGNAQAALAASEQALASEPGNRDAFSFSAIAAIETGADQRAARLLDPDLLIHPRQHTACAGFDDIAAFNRALADHVLAHPSLTGTVHNKATRNGAQTENLALGEQGPIAALQQLIGDALDDYLPAIGNSDHPYPPLIPNLTKLDIWGTVLGTQGHQTAHMHRAAWISGVYYVRLPEIMVRGSNGTEGWIEFCRPPDAFACHAPHPVRLIEPKEGLMVLFPSYIYHRTIPFSGDQQRISIAFDLLA